MKIELNKITNIEFEDIDFKDYPDFSDAYIVSAEIDGRELTEEELEEVNSSSSFVHESLMEYLYWVDFNRAKDYSLHVRQTKKMNTLNHISFEKNGNTWLGHIVGSDTEIELTHNSLFNFGATGTKDLDFVSPHHATFWTTEGQMRKYLVSRNLNMLLNQSAKFGSKGAIEDARKLASEQFANLKFDAQARSFEANNYEYEFQERKDVQKVETFSNYLIDLARGK